MNRNRSILNAWVLPALLAVVSAFGAALATAVILAVADIYVTGHGGTSLMQPWISWRPIVDLSPADVLLWFVVVVSGGAAFWMTRRGLTAAKRP